MAEIRVLDGAPTIGQKKDYGFSRTNTGQSYKKQNYETRDNSYSRVDKTGAAGSPQLQGFDQILQGFQGADDQDMEEWDALVTIGHPEILNGIQAMQGKKERKEKKAARKETKAAKKNEGKVFSPTAGKLVRAKKAERLDKKKQRSTIRTAKKDTKLARKQEKVLAKQANRLRKDQNAEARRLRKAGKDGKTAKEIFADLTEKGKDIATAIIGRPDQFDQSALDMNIPQDAGDLFDRWRGMDSEDVLDERAQIMADDDFDEGLYDEKTVEEAGTGADADAGDGKKGGNGMLYLGLAAAAALALKGGGKKKKTKK